MKRFIGLIMALSIVANAEFTRSDAGVVTDSITKLEWQDDYSDNEELQWANAILYCEALELDGGDWRLPNINELKSIIVDKAQPTISDVFENTDSSYYWSSTTYKYSSNYAWIVNFINGNVSNYRKNNYSSYVRCVRAGE